MNEIPHIPQILNTSENDITIELYNPCLRWALGYDRGVGYFTSEWIKVNAVGLSDFASRGGKARWVTSPILDEDDYNAFRSSLSCNNQSLIDVLKNNVCKLKQALEEDTLNSLAWMIYDGILEFRFAVPNEKLNGGDFHDKFGIFYGPNDQRISFAGSMNDSKKGYQNYECIRTFQEPNNSSLIDYDVQRFEKIWSNSDGNLNTYSMPEAVKQDIFQLRTKERPYINQKKAEEKENKWKHQDDAVEAFLSRGNGVLEMATGTGKTRTSLKIVQKLLDQQRIKSVIVTVKGSDLLDQWCDEISKWTDLNVNKQFASYKDLAGYLLNPNGAALVISREFFKDSIRFLNQELRSQTLIICDEVHGLGAPSLVNALEGKIKNFKYRLGLSATPERDYDDEGNDFIRNEIGDKIFEFTIQDAIRKGILCEFDYHPLDFELTDEDKKKIKNLIAAFSQKKKNGVPVRIEDLYRDLARVKKVSEAKLPVFYNFLKMNPEILERSIIFVETKEFGEKVQRQIIRYQPDFHTYYGEDDRRNLSKFSNGELTCLITSKRISEGIDIRSVNNIILFSADRAKIQTIQRIGRSLRIDPSNPHKKARIVDFIKVNDNNEEREDSDKERSDWLSDISKVKGESKIE